MYDFIMLFMTISSHFNFSNEGENDKMCLGQVTPMTFPMYLSQKFKIQ